MRRNKLLTIGLTLGLILLLVGVVSADSMSYAVAWRVVADGGQVSASTQYGVQGTLGQLAVGPAQSANDQISSGYWYTLSQAPIFLPIVSR